LEFGQTYVSFVRGLTSNKKGKYLNLGLRNHEREFCCGCHGYDVFAGGQMVKHNETYLFLSSNLNLKWLWILTIVLQMFFFYNGLYYIVANSTCTTSAKISLCYHPYFLLQVQEFEHINGYYSMPEMIRKPIEPIKAGSGAAAPGVDQGGEMPRSATTSTSATPATSAAASPAPTLNSQDESKDKEVRTQPFSCLDFVRTRPYTYFDFVKCVLLKDHTIYPGTWLPEFGEAFSTWIHLYTPLISLQSSSI
jgi:hypothetical protein